MKHREIIVDNLILLFLTIVFFWRVLFENKYLFFGDNLLSFYRQFYNLSVLKGFPLTLVKEFGLSVLYPTEFLISFLMHLSKDSNLGFRLIEMSLVFHFYLTSIFTYLLIRLGFNLNRLPSLFGAICFAFAGSFVTHILNFSFFYSITWLPLVFLLYLKGLKGKGVVILLFGGFILGLSVFTGRTYGLFYTSIVVLTFFLFNLSFIRTFNQVALIKKTVLILAIGWLIAGFYATMNFFLCSKSILVDSISCISVSSNVKFLSSVLLPNLHQRFNYWWETAVYLGSPTVIFALIAIKSIKKDKIVAYFLSLCAFSFIVVLLLSNKGIVLDKYLSLVPKVEFFSFPSRLRLISNFAFIVLACFGIDAFFYSESVHNSKFFKVLIQILLAFILLVASVIIPIVFVKTILNFDDAAFVKLNSFFWIILISCLSLLILFLRKFTKSKILIVTIIFLLITDIFTFWSNLNPINYRYGYGWEMKSPSQYGIEIK